MEYQTKEIVYKGRRMSSKNKPCECFSFVESDGLGDNMVFSLSARERAHLAIGAVYEVQAQTSDSGTTVKFGTLQYKRAYLDDREIATWQLQDETAMQTQRQIGQVKKLNSNVGVVKELAFLRDLYIRTHPSQRTALESAILKMVRGG